eukprot:28597-Amphidinium_carterae.1
MPLSGEQSLFKALRQRALQGEAVLLANQLFYDLHGIVSGDLVHLKGAQQCSKIPRRCSHDCDSPLLQRRPSR